MNRHALPPRDTAAQDDADAREFAEYARTQDPAVLQAALWATRRSEGLDAAAEREFQAWLLADARHAALHAEMHGSVAPVRALPASRIEALKAGVPAHASGSDPSRPAQISAQPPSSAAGRPRPAASSGRRAWLMGIGNFVPQMATAAAVVALVGGGWMGWNHHRSQPTFEKHYATQRGQRLNVELPDGSMLELDAATQAQVRLFRDHREVKLLDGQAMFSVQANPAQPFDVLAGPMRVTVVGTRFSVRHTGAGMAAHRTVIAVESGRVRVARGSAENHGSTATAAERVELTAGQAVSADPAGHLQAVISIPSGGVASWRKGRISFDDTPLGEAVAELERYGDTHLVIRDPAVAALRLGGSVDLRHIGGFVQALPSLLPVRLQKIDGRMEILPQP